MPGFGAEMGQCEISIVTSYLHRDKAHIGESGNATTAVAFEPFITTMQSLHRLTVISLYYIYMDLNILDDEIIHFIYNICLPSSELYIIVF